MNEKLGVPTNSSLEVPPSDVSASPTKLKSNTNFMRKIPKDAEASNILIGEMTELDRSILAFIRLSETWRRFRCLQGSSSSCSAHK